MRRLRQLFHVLWGHDWTIWETFASGQNLLCGGRLLYQRRRCLV